MGNITALALMGALVYFVYSVLSGGSGRRRDRVEDPDDTTQRARQAHSSARGEAEAMQECPTCGAYSPVSSSSNCGKENCPY